MAIMRVSRSASFIALCAAAWLPACATTTADDEIRKLEARASYEAGVKSISEGRVSLGLSSLRQAVEIEPRNPLYHNAVGAVMLNIGRYADAQVEFQKAVELDPSYADAFHNLGSAYAEQGKWEDAITAYRKALAQTIYNRPETTYNNLGYAYWALDRRKDAEIRGAALQRLTWDPQIPGDYIDVHVKDGWVTLKGEVDHQYQSDNAFNHVASLYGVTGVTNDIETVERQ